MSERKLDDFTMAYVVAALWSSMGDADANYSIEDIHPDTLLQMRIDCTNFQASHQAYLQRADTEEQNGHDFWLTRNGHGAGYWDRGYPNVIADTLTNAAHAAGEVYLYVGDDGRIYS